MTPPPKTSRKARYVFHTMLPQPQAGAVLDRLHSWTWSRDSDKENPGTFVFRATTYPKHGTWMTALGLATTLARLLFPSPNPIQDRTMALAQHKQREALKFRYSATLTTMLGSGPGSSVVLDSSAEPVGEEAAWVSAGPDPRDHAPVRDLVASIAKALGAVVSNLPEIAA
ncbi:MAG: hypothetical protein JNL97_06550 [Verrucomicrobiales bacterium]|nr:hypothetical protein [Verrucomicrobiales bacterium]